MARGMCQADVINSQRSPGFGSISRRVKTAFSKVSRERSSSVMRSLATPSASSSRPAASASGASSRIRPLSRPKTRREPRESAAPERPPRYSAPPPRLARRARAWSRQRRPRAAQHDDAAERPLVAGEVRARNLLLERPDDEIAERRQADHDQRQQPIRSSRLPTGRSRSERTSIAPAISMTDISEDGCAKTKRS